MILSRLLLGFADIENNVDTREYDVSSFQGVETSRCGSCAGIRISDILESVTFAYTIAPNVNKGREQQRQ